MNKLNLKVLIDMIFKILGLYEKIDINHLNYDDNFTKENYILYIEKTLVDIKGYLEEYKENEQLSVILNKTYLSVKGILQLIQENQDNHKIVRSKVLDITNNITRYLVGDDNE